MSPTPVLKPAFNLVSCVALFTLVLAMAACNRPDVPDTERPPEPQAEHTQLHDAIHAPLDKARAVEEATQKAADAQRAAIEKAGG
ncbi:MULTISPECIES: hypothetical protein [unclassified Lysobacter]